MRYIVFLIVAFSIIVARENPFEPVKTKTLKTLSHKSPLKEASLKKEEKEVKKLFRWISLSVAKEHIFLKTKDGLIKNFTIENPKKIVLDFKSNRSFKTKRAKLKNNQCIDEIALGAHKGYYRIALTFKKECDYKLSKEKGGYKLTFKPH